MGRRPQRVPRQNPNIPVARTWESLLELDEVPVKDKYAAAICQLASTLAHEKIDEAEEQGLTPAASAPDWEDHNQLFREAVAGQRPDWWPKRLDRVGILIRAQPEGSTLASYGPYKVDPNAPGLGLRVFISTLKTICGGLGEPYAGSVEIRIHRLNDEMTLSHWRSHVIVGDKLRPGKDGSGYDEDWDPILRHALKTAERKDELMMRMFSQASNVIHASAATVNASRGVNVPPPWMQGQEDENQPFWMALGQQAMQIAFTAATGQNPGQQAAGMASNILNAPVQPRALQQLGHGRRAKSPYGNAPQIPGPAPDQLGYGNYMEEEGTHDGYPVQEDDLLDDNFYDDDDDEFYDEDDDDDEFYDYEDDEDDEDDGYEDDEDDDNPLAGKSAQEVADYLNAYIDEHPNKGELKVLGVQLAGKLLGS